MKSFQHLYHDALLRRLIGTLEELNQVQTRIDLVNAGLAGEKRVKLAFEDCIRDEEIIMQYLQFVNENGFSHQIDLELLTTHFILLVEVKNISGALSYDPKLRQFTRTRFDGQVESFQNPFDQLQRHHEFMH